MFGSEPDHDSIDPNAPTQMVENQDDSETQIDTNAATQLVGNDEEQVKIQIFYLWTKIQSHFYKVLRWALFMKQNLILWLGLPNLEFVIFFCTFLFKKNVAKM